MIPITIFVCVLVNVDLDFVLLSKLYFIYPWKNMFHTIGYTSLVTIGRAMHL